MATLNGTLIKDGRVIRIDNSHTASFSDMVNGVGTEAQTSLEAATVYFKADTTESMWNTFHRLVFIYNTSALPDDCTIDSATFALRLSGKTDDLSCTPDVAVYGATTASDLTIQAADYATVQSTVLSDVKAYGDLSVGYVTFTLNAAGLAYISKTGLTKISLRNANHDVANIAPTWVSDVTSGLTFNLSGSIYTDPALTIVYTEAPSPEPPVVGSAAKAARIFQRM
jgi:hypothetical protein